MRNDIVKIRSYIESLNEGKISISENDDLIEKRLVDSLRFMDFVLYIEEVSGANIDMTSLNIEDFRSLARIEKAFFSGTAVPTAAVPA